MSRGTVTTRSGSGNGNGRTHNALTTVNTRRLTPIDTAKTQLAIAT